MRAPLREAAEETLEPLVRAAEHHRPVHRRAVADAAPARALLAAAAEADAALIVVGSSHAGFSGHVLPGSTGARLLDGAPCPVALAPQGHRLRPHLTNGRVTRRLRRLPDGPRRAPRRRPVRPGDRTLAARRHASSRRT